MLLTFQMILPMIIMLVGAIAGFLVSLGSSRTMMRVMVEKMDAQAKELAALRQQVFDLSIKIAKLETSSGHQVDWTQHSTR
jgi:uncharacterized membrane protein